MVAVMCGSELDVFGKQRPELRRNGGVGGGLRLTSSTAGTSNVWHAPGSGIALQSEPSTFAVRRRGVSRWRTHSPPVCRFGMKTQT